MKFNLVAFDLDGTIADTIPMCIEAFREAVSPYAGRVLSDAEIVATFGKSEEGMIAAVVGENRERALADFFACYERLHSMCPAPYEGIAELISELRGRAKVALVTGKGAVSCGITLRRFGLQDAFDDVRTGDASGDVKAVSLDALVDKYGFAKDECVYIGDAVSDVAQCKKAGVQCLSASWASSADIAGLEKANGGFVFKSIVELREFLLGRS